MKLCKTFGYILIALVCAAVFSLPIVLLTLQLLQIPRLKAAECHIEKVLSNERYQVYVLPDNTNAEAFTTTLMVDFDGFTGFEEDQKTKCYYSRRCNEGRCRETVQFDSNRPGVKTALVVVYSCWIAAQTLACIIAPFFMGERELGEMKLRKHKDVESGSGTDIGYGGDYFSDSTSESTQSNDEKV